jgi:hypothetical protein
VFSCFRGRVNLPVITAAGLKKSDVAGHEDMKKFFE